MSLTATTHEALVLSSAGGSPLIATVTISPHAHLWSYNYPRSLDLNPFNHLAHVKELSIDGELYCMFYALAPCMPINGTILEVLGLRSIPKRRLMYRGDVFFLKVKGPSERDICDRCYDDADMSVLPKLKSRLQHAWQCKLLESELGDMKQLISNPGSRRELSDADFDNLVEEAYEQEIILVNSLKEHLLIVILDTTKAAWFPTLKPRAGDLNSLTYSKGPLILSLWSKQAFHCNAIPASSRKIHFIIGCGFFSS
ncbi:hypothetical protein B0J17DRAFT_753897 [Rhizoctonia solani]|nr:hypothetical protein B0J17DRAFT_753897 [Rhizoctonia solani]